jgi:hypothetical protein
LTPAIFDEFGWTVVESLLGIGFGVTLIVLILVVAGVVA